MLGGRFHPPALLGLSDLSLKNLSKFWQNHPLSPETFHFWPLNAFLALRVLLQKKIPFHVLFCSHMCNISECSPSPSSFDAQSSNSTEYQSELWQDFFYRSAVYKWNILTLSSRRAYVRRHKKPSGLAWGVSATPWGNRPISQLHCVLPSIKLF